MSRRIALPVAAAAVMYGIVLLANVSLLGLGFAAVGAGLGLAGLTAGVAAFRSAGVVRQTRNDEGDERI